MSPSNYGHFANQFFDWLCLDYPFKNLRESVNLSREQLADMLQISHHSVRRYETENKAPHWYLILLRLIAGDLSFYGPQWAGCSIEYHNQQLRSPYLVNPIYPMEFEAMYNRHAQGLRTELAKTESRLNAALLEIEALKKLNSELMAKIDLLETEQARYKAEKAGIKKGVVIPLFCQK